MTTAHKSHDSAHDLSTEDRKEMKASTYAFPAQRKEPLKRRLACAYAIARFDQVKDVTDSEREEAFRHIQAAAEKFGVEMTETHWKQLGRKPHTANSAQK